MLTAKKSDALLCWKNLGSSTSLSNEDLNQSLKIKYLENGQQMCRLNHPSMFE